MIGERSADWDREWVETPLDLEAPHAEARTLRWREQERLIRERFGGFEGLRAIEIGAGRGLNAFLFAERGARVTLLDLSPIALEQARTLFDAHGLEGGETWMPEAGGRAGSGLAVTRSCPAREIA